MNMADKFHSEEGGILHDTDEKTCCCFLTRLTWTEQNLSGYRSKEKQNSQWQEWLLIYP